MTSSYYIFLVIFYIYYSLKLFFNFTIFELNMVIKIKNLYVKIFPHLLGIYLRVILSLSNKFRRGFASLILTKERSKI